MTEPDNLQARDSSAAAEQGIQSGALVHFIEVGQRLAFIKDAAVHLRLHWRTVNVVE